MSSHGDPNSTYNEDVEFEDSDMGITALVLAGIGALILTVIGMIFSLWFLTTVETVTIDARPTPLPLIEMRPTPPAPLLQPNALEDGGIETGSAEANLDDAEDDLAEMNAEVEAVLEEYEWVDENNGVARIPIESAIDLLAEDAAEEEPAQ